MFNITTDNGSIDMSRTAKIGTRFTVGLDTEPIFSRVIVWFADRLGRRFGSICLDTAKTAKTIHLYDQAEWSLDLPFPVHTDDWCLTPEEVAEVRAFANSVCA